MATRDDTLLHPTAIYKRVIMYKDRERQKEAVREAVRRFRAKGITVIPDKNVIPVIPVIPNVIPKTVQEVREQIGVKSPNASPNASPTISKSGKLPFCVKHRCYKNTCGCV